MIPNHSPWIKQLQRTRPLVRLSSDLQTDIAIVGAGIAGITTAYYILKETDKHVVIIESSKVAHGATGHNAGQLVTYFEKSLAELVAEFGFELATEGQRAIDSAWDLLTDIHTEAGLQTPLYQFTGYAGLTSLDQIIEHLASDSYRKQAGLAEETVTIAQEFPDLDKIPSQYKDSYKLMAHKDMLALLETDNPRYIALLSGRKGCMNSALLAEELLEYMLLRYGDRIVLAEESPVETIVLDTDHGSLKVGDVTVTAERIVLCTNGFTNFSILNKGGQDIDTKFHHLIHGRIGYMAAYLEAPDHPPAAMSYLAAPAESETDPTGQPYFYLTRRPHQSPQKTAHNLICIGGPEKVLPNMAIYSREDSCSEDVIESFDEFLAKNYLGFKHKDSQYEYCWHGLMGYTPNGIRRIGPEPCNPVLMYNLGCNGVGLLPSIYGSKKISQFLKGEKLPQSIFDPIDQRQ